MKIRAMLSVLLVLALVLTCAACGQEPEMEAETTKATQYQTEEKSTEKPTEQEAETEVPETTEETQPESSFPEKSVAQRISYPFDADFVPQGLPFLEDILGAPLESAETDEEKAYLLYTSADEDTLQVYLKLCAFSGLTSIEYTSSEKELVYGLIQAGSDFWGMVVLDKEEDYLLVAVDLESNVYNGDALNGIVEYYLQDLALPTENGPNVMPQFYASTNTSPYFQNVMGDLSYCFDNKMCWTEMYSGITLEKMWRYTSDMLLCGFDVWADQAKADDNGVVVKELLHFSNGDAEVIILYDAEDETATVHYKPEVLYNLLSGADYLQYIP